jgi:dTMP kinase
VVETHEPGGTPLGAEVRQLVLARSDLGVNARAESLLMNASRAQLVAEVIRPALARGEIVVSDRFADSTLAYQGAGRGIDMAALDPVIFFATAGLKPDMTILLDVPVEVGLARKHAVDSNRFEAEALAVHERVRGAYHDLARAEPARWHCLDGRRTADELAVEIWDLVATRLGGL